MSHLPALGPMNFIDLSNQTFKCFENNPVAYYQNPNSLTLEFRFCVLAEVCQERIVNDSKILRQVGEFAFNVAIHITQRVARLSEAVILLAVWAIAPVELPLTVAIAKTADVVKEWFEKITTYPSRDQKKIRFTVLVVEACCQKITARRAY